MSSKMKKGLDVPHAANLANEKLYLTLQLCRIVDSRQPGRRQLLIMNQDYVIKILSMFQRSIVAATT